MLRGVRKTIILVLAVHSVPIIAVSYILGRVSSGLTSESSFVLTLVFVGIFLYAGAITDSEKYFALGKKFVELCPRSYLNAFSKTIRLLLASAFVLFIASFFLGISIGILILLGLLLVLLCLDKLLYGYMKRTISTIGNLKIFSNVTCSDICNAIYALSPIYTLFAWNSDIFLQKIEKYRRYSEYLHEICEAGNRLQKTCNELSVLVGLEVVKGGHAPSRNRIVRIYQLEVELLEALLGVLRRLILPEVKILVSGFLLDEKRIECLKKLGEMLEDAVKRKISSMELFKLLKNWLRICNSESLVYKLYFI